MQFRLIIYADITMQGIQRIEMCNSSTNFYLHNFTGSNLKKKLSAFFAPV